MRLFNRQTWRSILLVGLFIPTLGLLAPAPVVADPIISLTPSLTTVFPGDTFTLDVEITGAVGVFGWQVDISFDPAIINIVSTTEGAFLTAGAATTFFINGTLDNGTGLVDNMANTRTGPVGGVSGAGVLASLTFQAVGLGVTAVTLSNVLLSDSAAQPLTLGSTSAASVNVVPEPGSWLLLLSGLPGVAVWGRSRKRVK